MPEERDRELENENAQGRSPFHVRDCSLVAMATGIRAQNLREFRDGLLACHPGSIYHHFWGRLLQPQFDEPEYSNDFAAWVFHGLHEKALAERLSVVDPREYDDMEALRDELVERVELHLEEMEFIPWARADQQFHFMRSAIVVFDTGVEIQDPAQLADLVAHMSLGSVFYHFIDARRRTEHRCDDFCAWLGGMSDTYPELRRRIMTLDPYFSSLKELRFRLAELFREYFAGGET
ncbi:DUF5752 family protein [Dissulfurirhabdus thermomarina]|nr:DUF5752 family protein [Dissulfurirhabdus thermomarina]